MSKILHVSSDKINLNITNNFKLQRLQQKQIKKQKQSHHFIQRKKMIYRTKKIFLENIFKPTFKLLERNLDNYFHLLCNMMACSQFFLLSSSSQKGSNIIMSLIKNIFLIFDFSLYCLIVSYIMKKNKLDAFEEDSQQILRQLQRNYLQVLTTLGYGTFGRVKLVKFRGKEQVYALKIMRKQQILQQNQLMHLHSQKQVLLEVNHPNIVALKSTFQDPKHIYMMFEYIQGGELFARLTRNGRFNNDAAMFYVAGILDAICHLHTKDIVFRDLKPENIMVDSEGYPKLIDLGFAKKLHHLRTFTICGTPEYLAPEMLEKTNKSGYGKAVDYWGIGILIYELLAGYPPFYDNQQPRNIYKKIIKGVIQFPQFFSLRAKHLILSLLNPNPQKRLGSRNNGEDIKNHAWFKKFDWTDIRNAKVPWKPPIKDPHDATNFQQVSASRGTTVSIPEQDQNLFQGF